MSTVTCLPVAQSGRGGRFCFKGMVDLSEQVRQVMTADYIRRALTRLAHEIVEKNGGAEGIALVGILRQGAPLADWLAVLLKRIEGVDVPVGKIDIALYRNDYHHRQPVVEITEIDLDISDRKVVLVDEVILTERAVRSAKGLHPSATIVWCSYYPTAGRVADAV